MMEQTAPSLHPLDFIISKFKQPDMAPGTLKSNFSIGDKLPEKQVDRKDPQRLEPGTIAAPALILDHGLRVVWHNMQAQASIWHLSEQLSDAATPPHIFDLLFDPRFRNRVDNWRHWVVFFLRQALTFLSMEDLQKSILLRKKPEYELLHAMLISFDKRFVVNGAGVQIRQNMATESICFQVVGTTFGRKRLIVFEPHPVMHNGVDFEAGKEIVRRYATPVQSYLYVLAARLHDADTLRAEMLDEEYGGLMSRILEIVIATLEQYNGLFCQHSGGSVLGFFLPSDQSGNNPLSIIQCALELNARMKELGREWKIRKGWLHDIELNIGISVGSEYLLALPTSLGSNLTCLGNTQAVAICLSDLSTNGQIWATKTLINQIPPSKLTEIRFGLFRGESQRQVFVARSFSRIRDLSDTTIGSAYIGDELGCRAVTRIFDCQGFG